MPTPCDFSDCPYENICCCGRVYWAELTEAEENTFTNREVPDGKKAVAIKENGYCVYWNEEDKTCAVYENRPLVCQGFTCEGKDASELQAAIVLRDS